MVPFDLRVLSVWFSAIKAFYFLLAPLNISEREIAYINLSLCCVKHFFVVFRAYTTSEIITGSLIGR